MSSTTVIYRAVRTLVYVQWLGAAVLSFTHIVEVGLRFGLSWEAWTAPFLIDAFALLGAVGRGRAFTSTTRRAGLQLMIGAGLVSLTCNVEAGHNIGQRVFGVLVVAGFITAEWYASKLRPRRASRPRVRATAPVSPGRPPLAPEPAEVLAYRRAVDELRRTSSLAGLNDR
jgi:hypothetical protein